MAFKKKCLHCGKEYSAWGHDVAKRKFCSKACYGEDRVGKKFKKSGIIKKCLHCGSDFYVEYGKKDKVRFCRPECWDNFKTGKSYEELYGEEKAKKAIKKKSVSMSGEKHPLFNKHHRTESLKKMRIATIKRIKKNYGILWPNYSKEACEFFKSFDEKHKTKGNYAVYGGGEYYIEELGYWPDYFNPELKLIMEYDDRKHFDKNGNLKPRDVRRQAEIQALYPDFEFQRIKENEGNGGAVYGV